MRADRRTTLRGRAVLALAATTIALAACAPRQLAEDAPPRDNLRALGDIAATLPGTYSNHLQWRDDDRPGGGPVVLSVAAEAVDEASRLAFRLRQQAGDGPAREFLLELAATSVAGRLSGRWTPLAAGGARVGCDMRFTLASAGLSGETRPADCVFGQGDDAVGLLKEIAFDGRQIIIADQLFTARNQPVGETEVLRFFRQRAFTGWAGVRDGAQWRLAGELELHSEGSEIEPMAADGAPLGLRIQLARVDWREDQAPILRLSVYNDSGALLGYAWADEDAAKLGINLPEVQVGLEALPE